MAPIEIIEHSIFWLSTLDHCLQQLKAVSLTFCLWISFWNLAADKEITSNLIRGILKSWVISEGPCASKRGKHKEVFQH